MLKIRGNKGQFVPFFFFFAKFYVLDDIKLLSATHITVKFLFKQFLESPIIVTFFVIVELISLVDHSIVFVVL